MSIDPIAILFTFHTFYFVIIGLFAIGILFLSKKRDDKIKPISVIIAARNEEEHIEKLVSALSEQTYPKEMFEVIIVDDRSNDKTFEICKKLMKSHNWLNLMQVKEENPKLAGKKGALDHGIRNAKYDILAFTDADCLPRKGWLSAINALMTDDTDFLCGYSPLIVENKLLSGLKNLERASIFAVIAGSFGLDLGITSVARNQIYRKSLFMRSNGFEGIGHIRSGDDDLLLLKMNSNIRKRKFMFDTYGVVPSFDKTSKEEMTDLETRRASKWKYYPVSIKALSLLVMLYYICLIIALPFAIFGDIRWTEYLIVLGSKIFVEFILLFTYLLKQKELKLLNYFALAELLYVPYFIYFGLKGTFGKYSWKN